MNRRGRRSRQGAPGGRSPLWQPQRALRQLFNQLFTLFEEFSRCLRPHRSAGKAADRPGRPARIGDAAAQRGRAGQSRWGPLAGLAARGAFRHCPCTPKPPPCCHPALERSGAHLGGEGDGTLSQRAPQPPGSTGRSPCLCGSPSVLSGSYPPSSRSFEVSASSPAGRQGGRSPRKTGTASAMLQHSVGGQASPLAGLAARGCSSALPLHAQAAGVLPPSPGTL